jgi:hypothetical protein
VSSERSAKAAWAWSITSVSSSSCACVEGAVTSIDLSHGDRIIGRFDYHAGIDALAYDAARALLYAPSAKAGRMAGLEIDRDGQPTLAFEVTTEKGASCLTVDSSGTVWICDPLHGGVLVSSAARSP